MNDHTKEHTIDLSGAVLTIDGADAKVEEGTFTLRENYLYSANDSPDNPTQIVPEISIDAESVDWEVGDTHESNGVEIQKDETGQALANYCPYCGSGNIERQGGGQRCKGKCGEPFWIE